ncbi:hypothetical protein QCN29_29560 [Streptomyces sp. HNM0663]|uniref:Secreted protein n=1 Tax=Streptomyces chengmaiensis TaxID=3040919 RepID=A0ABT6HVW1_9ACTN|nr:hypothetical protein [Streptomyces chengmaiensis]MDH2392856.1 hypothetical protein [Streptomyces chengmaiensis]
MPMSRLLWWGGLATAASGAVLCVIGWYGASGERYAEQQIPYLASSTIPGAALLVAAAVLTVGAALLARAGPGSPAAAEKPEPALDASAAKPSSDEPPVCVPGGTLAHRPDCPLVTGKEQAVPAGDRKLDPCPVCEPRI